jgi:hypothetical protein
MVKPRVAHDHLSTFYPQTMTGVTHKVLQLDEEYPGGHDVTGLVDPQREKLKRKPSKNYKVELWKLSLGQSGATKDEWRRRTFVVQKNMLVFESQKQYGHVKRVCNLMHTTSAVRGKKGPFEFCLTLTYANTEADGEDAECTLAAERRDVMDDFIHEIAPQSTTLGRLVKE